MCPNQIVFSQAIHEAIQEARSGPRLCGYGHVPEKQQSARGGYKLVYGVGRTDTYTMTSGQQDREYVIWQKILGRCYSERIRKLQPTYEECSVDPRWHSYAEFKAWYSPRWYPGADIDKDILVQDNRVYGPDTCAMVPARLNGLFKKSVASKSAHGLGVQKTTVGRFASKMCVSLNGKNRTIHFGTFDTAREAFLVYRKYRKQFMCDMAQAFYDAELITKPVLLAVRRHKIEMFP